jgi:hypothetical protein
MTTIVTNRAKYRLGAGTLNASTDIRVALLIVTPDAVLPAGAFDADLNDMAALLAVATVDECSVSGYGRVAITAKTVTEDDVNNWALLDCDNIAFGALTTGQTLRGAAWYVEGVSDSARELLIVSDENFTGSGIPTNGGTFTLTTASGWAKIL